jgi:ketosteroid isomerase-like protein
MSASDLIRKYFAAYENKDRMAVESLLTNDFIFTSPYDHRVDVKRFSNAAGPIARNPQRMALRRCLRKATKSLSSMTARPKMAADPGTRNSLPSKETR